MYINRKIISVEILPGTGGRGELKKRVNGGEGEFKYDIFYIL
jgi:hypothetical protein